MPYRRARPDETHPFEKPQVIFFRALTPPRSRELTDAELNPIPPEDRELIARLRREVYDAFEEAITKAEQEREGAPELPLTSAVAAPLTESPPPQDRKLFGGSSIDGFDVDIFEWAGLDLTAEEQDLIWADHDEHSIMDECPSAYLEVDDKIDDAAPGLNDSRFSVWSPEPDKVRAELRAFAARALGYQPANISTAGR